MAGIFIPEDGYFHGFEETVSLLNTTTNISSTVDTNVYVALPQKGFASGIMAWECTTDTNTSGILFFNATSAQAFGRGGRLSSSGDAIYYRSRLHYSSLSDAGNFGTNIFLKDLYIDDANERIVLVFRSSSGTQQLKIRASFRVYKGESV